MKVDLTTKELGIISTALSRSADSYREKADRLGSKKILERGKTARDLGVRFAKLRDAALHGESND